MRDSVKEGGGIALREVAKQAPLVWRVLALDGVGLASVGDAVGEGERIPPVKEASHLWDNKKE